MIINPYLFAPTVDADAQAFITAAGITDPTQQSAIITLVTDLKGYNIWTKFKAIYPIVGGSASSHAVNLKGPGTYNLSFSLGWTHSSTGMTPNGSSAYANTSLNPSIIINNANDGHLSYYSRSNTTGINAIDIGCIDGITGFDMVIRFGGSNLAGACINMLDSNVFTNANNSTGLYHANQNNTPNVRKMFRNGSAIATQTVSQNSTPNFDIFIGARNSNGNPFFYTNRECSFASIGNGLSDTEAANFYTAVQAYQTTLGRQV